MTRSRRWALLVARAVVATALGLGVGALVRAQATPYSSPELEAALADPVSALRSDRLEATVAELSADGVSVSDDGRYLLDEEGERLVEEAVDRVNGSGSARVYVVVWAPGQELGAQEIEVVDLLAQRLVDDPGVDRGYLLVWQGPEDGFVERLGFRYVPSYRLYGPEEFLGDPAVTLPRIVGEIEDTDYLDNGAERAAEIAERRAEETEALRGGGDLGDVLLGVLVGGAVLAALAALGLLGRLTDRRPDPALGEWQPRKDAS